MELFNDTDGAIYGPLFNIPELTPHDYMRGYRITYFPKKIHIINTFQILDRKHQS